MEQEKLARWKELQKGTLKCEKCSLKVSEMDQCIPCRMPPSYVIHSDLRNPNGCLRILCRSCATSSSATDLPFEPCQCYTLGDHEHFLWCQECTKSMERCQSCNSRLCQYCTKERTQRYGLLCEFCVWETREQLGRMPKGVTFLAAPWPRYSSSGKYVQAVQELIAATGRDEEARDMSNEPDTDSDEPKNWVYVLLHKEGGPYRSPDFSAIGAYTCLPSALEGARRKFESLSHGFYKDGAFTEPEIFEETFDDTRLEAADVGGEDRLLYQEDMEGEWSEICLTKLVLEGQTKSKEEEETDRKRPRLSS